MTGKLGEAGLGDEGVHEALSLCLECRACKAECPVGVDMGRYKSEFLAARWERQGGPPLRARVLGILSVCIGSAAIGFVQLGVIASLYGAVAASTFTGVAGLAAMALTWRWWKLI